MKSIVKIIALVLVVCMFASVALVACGDKTEDPKDSTTTTEATKEATTTLAPPPVDPGDDTGDDDDEFDIYALFDGKAAETLVTGDEAKEYHYGHKTIKVEEVYASFGTFGGEEKENLVDGRDGWLYTEDDEGNEVPFTKICGGTNLPMIAFKLEPGKKLVGYTFVSGNDSETYVERHPKQWVVFNPGDLSGSDDWTEALDPDSEKDWAIVDIVADANIDTITNFTPYNYTVDNEGEYEYLVFDFTSSYGADGTFPIFQLTEIYFYYE